MKPTYLYNELISYCIVKSDDSLVRKYSRYFKEGVYNAFGLTQQLMNVKVDAILSNSEVDFKLIRETCKLLVKGEKYEETGFAILFYKSYTKQFSPATFKDITVWFETGISNWAHCDVICSELLSVLLQKNYINIQSFKPWITAKNKYQRRAVPVALIKHLKTTRDYKPFFRLIQPLMSDPDREVHQGMGWFLREAWKKQPEETETYLLKWKDTAPRLIIQYACEKMSTEEKLRFRRNKGV
jgi:3-methyladenine DNA glycosylase AlkD